MNYKTIYSVYNEGCEGKSFETIGEARCCFEEMANHSTDDFVKKHPLILTKSVWKEGEDTDLTDPLISEDLARFDGREGE